MARQIDIDDPTMLVPAANAKVVQAILDRAHRDEAQAGRSLQSNVASHSPGVLSRVLARALIEHGNLKRRNTSLRPTAAKTGGRSFHFDYSTVGKGEKRKSKSEGASATKSAADKPEKTVDPARKVKKPDKHNNEKTKSQLHQEYIERMEAVAEIGDRAGAEVVVHNIDHLAASPDMTGSDLLAGRAASAQAYVENPEKVEGVYGDATSFGTIGVTHEERLEFWALMEQHTAEKAGRTQVRLVLELPHEATPQARQQVVREYCRFYEEQGVPYWACIHAPTEKNDDRNHHAHIIHTVRPAKKMADPVTGLPVWDFSVIKAYRTKSGNNRVSHPYRQIQHPLFRQRDYPRQSRERFAAIVNMIMERNDCSVRYDARSYRAMGVEVTPVRGTPRKAAASAVPDAVWLQTHLDREATYAAKRQEKALRTLQAERSHFLAACAEVDKPAKANRLLPVGMKVSPFSRLTPMSAKAIGGEMHDLARIAHVSSFADQTVSATLEVILEATAPSGSPDYGSDREGRDLLRSVAQQELHCHQQRASEHARRIKGKADAACRRWRQEAAGMSRSIPSHVPSKRLLPSMHPALKMASDRVAQSLAMPFAMFDDRGRPEMLGEMFRAQYGDVNTPARAFLMARQAAEAPNPTMRRVAESKAVPSLVVGEAEEILGSLTGKPAHDRVGTERPHSPIETARPVGSKQNGAAQATDMLAADIESVNQTVQAELHRKHPAAETLKSAKTVPVRDPIRPAPITPTRGLSEKQQSQSEQRKQAETTTAASTLLQRTQIADQENKDLAEHTLFIRRVLPTAVIDGQIIAQICWKRTDRGGPAYQLCGHILDIPNLNQISDGDLRQVRFPVRCLANFMAALPVGEANGLRELIRRAGLSSQNVLKRAPVEGTGRKTSPAPQIDPPGATVVTGPARVSPVTTGAPMDVEAALAILGNALTRPIDDVPRAVPSHVLERIRVDADRHQTTRPREQTDAKHASEVNVLASELSRQSGSSERAPSSAARGLIRAPTETPKDTKPAVKIPMQDLPREEGAALVHSGIRAERTIREVSRSPEREPNIGYPRAKELLWKPGNIRYNSKGLLWFVTREKVWEGTECSKSSPKGLDGLGPAIADIGVDWKRSQATRAGWHYFYIPVESLTCALGDMTAAVADVWIARLRTALAQSKVNEPVAQPVWSNARAKSGKGGLGD